MKGVRRASFSEPALANSFGMKLQHLSNEELDRMSLERRALSAKMGAEETGRKCDRIDEKPWTQLKFHRRRWLTVRQSWSDVSRSEVKRKSTCF